MGNNQHFRNTLSNWPLSACALKAGSQYLQHAIEMVQQVWLSCHLQGLFTILQGMTATATSREPTSL
jgi:hypothetical protein